MTRPVRDDVELRPVRPEDLAEHFAQQADPASAAMAAVPIRDRQAFEAHWASLLPNPDCLLRSIVVDGAVVGSAVSFVRDGERHIGYRIAQQHWGKGIATAALGRLLDEVRERPLVATVAEHNRASLRILERHGFVRVGEVRDGDLRLFVLRLR